MNDGVLTQLRARLGRWTALRVVLTLAAVLGGLALAAVLLDVVLDLSEPARLAAPWVLVCFAVAVLIRAWVRSRSLSEFRAARLFERAGLSPGNRMSNAVQLAGQTAASPVGEFLRAESIELGRQSAAQLQTWPVVRGAIKLAAAATLIVLVLWAGLVALAPDMLQAVMPRYTDPRGDHPPFSRLKINVTPDGANVLYGGQVEIKASASGRPADKLWLVARAGANTARTMMFLAPDKSFFQTLANIREPAEYYVTDGRARSRKFPIAVRYTPQIILVEVTTTFPEYTAKPPKTAKLSDEPQALPEGTKVSYRVVSNRPLKSGALDLTPVLGGKPVRVPLAVDGQSNVVSGAFTLTEPTVFTVSVSDEDGLTSADPRKGRFNISPDERPRLFVLEPGRDAVATPSIKIPVRVQAADDYGVTRVLWLRGHNRSIERAFSMKVELKGGPQSVESTGAFDLAKLGVRPGDVIDYYFEAADNYPQGPNVTLSRFFRLQVISEEQYRDYLRQAAARKALFEPYFQLNSWLQRLAERARELETRANSGSADQKALAEDTKKLADDLDKYQEQLGKLLGEAMMFDVEKSFRETLVAQHTGVEQARDQLRKSAGGKSGEGVSEAAKKLSELAATSEQDVAEPAEQIASVARLISRADTFVKLAKQEAAVAQLLRRYTENTAALSRLEQMEVQELAHQQRLIQEGLRKFLASLQDSLAEIPEEEQFASLRQDVTNFVAAVKDAQIEEDIGNASSFLGNLDAASGYAAAQSAATKMDKLIAKCNSMADEGKAGQCLSFRPSISQSMGNTLQQILDAMGAGAGRKPGSGKGGERGQGGYSLFNNDVGIYGPNMELAGEQAGGRGDSGRSGGRPSERFSADPGDPARPGPRAPGRVKLRTDAKFPLRYRDLVGEYFRAIAESQIEEPK